jgi:two-component sensor histidine kinase
MFSLSDHRVRAERVLAASPAARYAAAAALVFVTIGVRLALDPVFRPGVYYHLYYPAVILAAYLFGGRAGTFAVALSAGCAYWLIAEPAFRVKTDPQAYLPLATFAISASVAVFVLSHVRGRLSFLTGEFNRIDALTHSQAELFREHAERVSNHLQLISAILQSGARSEAAPLVSRVLMNAASRTMLISRMHRSFSKRADDVIDFNEFAIRIVEAALAAHNRPPIAVLVEGERLIIPLEHATSLALVLLEWLNARASHGAPGVVRVLVSRNDGEAVFQIVEEGIERRATSQRDAHLIAAIAEQMRGNLVMSVDESVDRLWLSFPTALQPLPAFEPLHPLH